jgi:hypothetical protein
MFHAHHSIMGWLALCKLHPSTSSCWLALDATPTPTGSSRLLLPACLLVVMVVLLLLLLAAAAAAAAVSCGTPQQYPQNHTHLLSCC